MIRRPPRSTLFPTTLFRSIQASVHRLRLGGADPDLRADVREDPGAEELREEVVPGFVVVEVTRSEEHTSELQSRPHLVCRLLLAKKKREKLNLPNQKRWNE